MKSRCVLAFVLLASIPLAAQLPQGTILPARLSSRIDTRKSKPGDRISARVMQDVPLGRGHKVPEGARLVGEIIQVRPSSVSWKFDQLVVRKKSTPIRTNLRALASFMEIHDAQLPTNTVGGDRGSSDEDWNTVQVGGDIVYGRRGGPVVHGNDVVGHSLFRDGVLATPAADRGSPCRGAIGTDAPQAFWLFSASACGLYGYPDVRIAHAGRSNPIGTITLVSEKRIKIGAGSGILLRTAEPSD